MKGLIGKILLASLLLLPLFSVCAYAQLDAATMAKRQARKNLVIREWNTDAKTQTKWLDRITTYDDQGRFSGFHFEDGKLTANYSHGSLTMAIWRFHEDGSADLHYVLTVAASIGKCMSHHMYVVDKSTVPVMADAGSAHKQVYHQDICR